MLVELANVFATKVRLGELSIDIALANIDGMSRQFRFVPDRPIDAALRIAFEHRRSLYDSLYVAVAVAHECQLVTADRPLYNALAPHLPGVMLRLDDVAADDA